METINCDLNLGGSTKQLIEWNIRNNVSAEVFAKHIRAYCKTIPEVMARRCACLIGIAATELDSDALDYVTRAVRLATTRAAERG